MSQSSAPHIVVIGAGMAGLACAGALHPAGADVTLLDKSRHVGGRLATRRVGDLMFDHGAQYVTSRDPGFVTEMQAMAAAGDAAPWPAAGGGRWCGVPGMSALARHMERQGVVRTARHAAFLSGWALARMILG